MKVGLLVLTVWALLGSSPLPVTDKPATNKPVDQKLLLRGLSVYHASYCGTCHTLTAAHTKGTFGPPHDHLLRRIQKHFADGSYKGTAQTAEAYLRESILDPGAYLEPDYAGSRYRMPAFTNLNPEDLDALIALLAQP